MCTQNKALTKLRNIMWQASIDNVVFPDRHSSPTCTPATPGCSLKLTYFKQL